MRNLAYWLRRIFLVETGLTSGEVPENINPVYWCQKLAEWTIYGVTDNNFVEGKTCSFWLSQWYFALLGLGIQPPSFEREPAFWLERIYRLRTGISPDSIAIRRNDEFWARAFLLSVATPPPPPPPPFTILYLDEFNVDEAAPIASPHTGDVGTFLVNQNSPADAEITGGALHMPSGATGQAQFYTDTALARIAGRTFKATRVAEKFIRNMAWDSTPLSYGGIIRITERGEAIIFYPGTSQVGTVIGTGVDTELAMVLRTAGAFFFKKPSGDVWQLEYVSNQNTTSPLNAAFQCINQANGAAGRFAVADINTVAFTDDNGIRVLYREPPISGTAYSATNANDLDPGSAFHELLYTLPGVPSLGDKVELRFRVQDGSNYWTAYVEYDGAQWDHKVDTVSGGVPTNRYTLNNVGDTSGIAMQVKGAVRTRSNSRNVAGPKWDDRMNLALVSHLDTETDVAAVSVNVTLDRLESYARESTLYTALDGW